MLLKLYFLMLYWLLADCTCTHITQKDQVMGNTIKIGILIAGSTAFFMMAGQAMGDYSVAA
ncbi:MAG TPA: hypothetical protein DEQ20_04970 [Desulfobulbaceae bacterium]|nr:MAG: hypothetical protein A2520_03235 [Deltaproteobacteria bacterium RIFOXYD12_FULL_53_23]HCC54263.1 hypothetical protein [Desulfobulbaceae bacterium]